MTESDRIAYGRAGRLRVALSTLAAEIADDARGMVPTTNDSNIYGRGDWIEAASQLAAQARELVTLAALAEHRRGVSWEAIGEVLGISKQAAQQRFAPAEKETGEALIEHWLTGGDRWNPNVPEGADRPAEAAGKLDRWSGQHGGPPAREHPVSGNLEPMTTIEHMTMVTAAASLVMDRRRAGGEAGRIRELELGLARRKVELYERLSLEGPGPLGGTRAEEIADLLTGARARLADLEATASKGSAA
jgi:hypothetical protein